ncbi:MAG: PIG-L family deacetylase [Acidobacteriia bacterium]|nr:PIG-L family deacetylase [Terriglobia bacterium]
MPMTIAWFPPSERPERPSGRRGLSKPRPGFFRIRALCGLLLLLGPIAKAQEATTFSERAHDLPRAARVLMTGAHPDDENSALLAYLSQEQFVHCAYLSATRGEGGQNLIGPELFDSLGILRTEEMLAARGYDHCQQFFTRAYDFGFSKDPKEALEKWGRDVVLGDMVRVIRRYQPDIIISVWRGTAEDGHGHHQAIGILTPEAFRAAADPNRFPEQLTQGLHPWQAQKLYVTGRDPHEPGSFSLDVGQFSPQLGKSMTEIAAIGRSQHQSQGQGAEQRKGRHPVYLRLIASASSSEPPDLSSGSQPSQTPADPAIAQQAFHQFMQARMADWTALAGGELDRVPFLSPGLSAIDSLAMEMAGHAPDEHPSASVPALIKGIEALRSLRQRVLSSALSEGRQLALAEHLRSKEEDFTEALIAALGLSFEVRSDQPSLTPGSGVTVTATLLNRSDVRIEPVTIEPASVRDWTVKKTSGELKPLRYNEKMEWKFSATASTAALPTEMYWLRLPREGDRYAVANQALVGRAENPPEIPFVAAFRVADDPSGASFQVVRPVEFMQVDPRYGERRESFKVVPVLSVSSLPDELIIASPALAQSKTVFVRLESEGAEKVDGVVKLILPRGWSSSPITTAFSTAGKEQVVLKKFVLRVPPRASTGDYRILAVATVGKENFSRGFQRISYPHIREQNFYRPAETVAHVTPLKLPPGLKVGYIMGTGDRIPEGLEQMGVSVTLLDDQALAIGSLDGFDAIITGIRAYDVRRDLDQNNGRLLDYVKKGGTLIVQYNSASFGLDPARVPRLEMDSPDREEQISQRTALLKELEEFKGPQSAEKITAYTDPVRQFGPYPLLRWQREEVVRERSSARHPDHEAEPPADDLARIVDERAPVHILVAKNPVFSSPNAITEKDFEGWVQERGLNFMRTWDEHYTPLLASHDPGEKEQLGGMLYTRYGRGNFVYTGYSWFRQFPAGVSGGYRIFANLISLSREQAGK